ncbi:hypothetical protein BH09MYX1_BH09MYX1_37090 [soil metagenome]
MKEASFCLALTSIVACASAPTETATESGSRLTVSGTVQSVGPVLGASDFWNLDEAVGAYGGSPPEFGSEVAVFSARYGSRDGIAMARRTAGGFPTASVIDQSVWGDPGVLTDGEETDCFSHLGHVAWIGTGAGVFNNAPFFAAISTVSSPTHEDVDVVLTLSYDGGVTWTRSQVISRNTSGLGVGQKVTATQIAVEPYNVSGPRHFYVYMNFHNAAGQSVQPSIHKFHLEIGKGSSIVLVDDGWVATPWGGGFVVDENPDAFSLAVNLAQDGQPYFVAAYSDQRTIAKCPTGVTRRVNWYYVFGTMGGTWTEPALIDSDGSSPECIGETAHWTRPSVAATADTGFAVAYSKQFSTGIRVLAAQSGSVAHPGSWPTLRAPWQPVDRPSGSNEILPVLTGTITPSLVWSDDLGSSNFGALVGVSATGLTLDGVGCSVPSCHGFAGATIQVPMAPFGVYQRQEARYQGFSSWFGQSEQYSSSAGGTVVSLAKHTTN